MNSQAILEKNQKVLDKIQEIDAVFGTSTVMADLPNKEKKIVRQLRKELEVLVFDLAKEFDEAGS